MSPDNVLKTTDEVAQVQLIPRKAQPRRLKQGSTGQQRTTAVHQH